MELSDVIASRRSIRKFRREDISADEALGRYTLYKFIVKAAVIFVCCADLTAITTRERRVGELLKEGAFEGVDSSLAQL